MKTMKTIKKCALMAALVIWAAASLLLLCAEDTPGQTMSLGLFVGSKLLALASMAVCCAAIRKAERSGLMPDFWYANDDNTL